ncbi:MAG TPA: site-specific recombinase [Aquabacterium sp.]|uniref:site-specific recombinase n=1 Tax=Aquabacterium sp. TaxID=1872578 RepID=UPI002E313E56|nr:site-specific recombinase [Aquabacterium sp.]HEX5373000.1 site-specific recombinase [Aquabacterium sp.]
MTGSTPRSIDDLLRQAPMDAPRAERHLWLIELLAWVRQGDPVTGVQYVLRHLDDQPQARERVVSLLAVSLDDLHLSSLLADHGFAPRAALLSELGERLRGRLLPASPDTRDLSTLFGLLFDVRTDHVWVEALEEDTLTRLGALLGQAWQCADASGGWRPVFMSALSILASQVRAAGLSRELRLRMGDGPEVAQAFGQLARAAEDMHDLIDAGDQVAVLQQAQYLRALLDRCVQLAEGVHDHLEAYGVSVDVVFQIDQLRARCQRMEQVLDCLLSPEPHREMRALVLALIQQGQARRSVRALFTRQYSLLARLVAERSAETGEHYITRTRSEYVDMLRRAAGGGLVIVGTTFAKFFLLALGLSAFWSGFAAGTNYALSFVLIHLLHWTVATKQPAMTAPAMAAKLRDTHDEAGVEGFVDEVAHLIRSQMAGIIGNLAVVAPVVLLIQGLAWWVLGRPLIDEAKAGSVLDHLTLWGPSLFFAAFTGVLLFISSLIAGWVENWFVWHRLDSALQWHPRIRVVLGPTRAARWSLWWRENISGLAANVSLGFLLGLTPALAGFFGLPLDVRHVTLSTGQIAAALGTLGLPALHDAHFWWCVAAIPLTGLLNVGVSFVLALRVAVRSRGVRVKDRARLARALGRRLLRQPLSFLLPPKAVATKHLPPGSQGDGPSSS